MSGIAFLGPRRLVSPQARVWSWIVASILALFFTIVALPKLLGLPFERDMFENWGYPVWFMYAVGLGEALFALLLLIPATRFWGACLICLEMVGAALTHIVAAEYVMLPMPLATMAAAFWLAWLERPAREHYRGPARGATPA